MDHAIGAFLVITGAVGVPVGLLHQLLECLRVTLPPQIEGALPAAIVSRRVAPGSALVGLAPREEIDEQARLVERPAAPLVALEDLSEQLLGAAPIEKML